MLPRENNPLLQKMFKALMIGLNAKVSSIQVLMPWLQHTRWLVTLSHKLIEPDVWETRFY